MLSSLHLNDLRHGTRIGLLGGSFNPAHEGHCHITRTALDRLALDRVWWVVSQQNPLKSTDITADFDRRLAYAKTLVHDRRIEVTDVERRLGTQYTIDTLRALKRAAPHINFVWLMGADNFIQLPQWREWTNIMSLVPVAVIARPGYHLRAGLSQAACRYGVNRLKSDDAAYLADAKPPAWTLIVAQLRPISSTLLRDAANIGRGV